MYNFRESFSISFDNILGKNSDIKSNTGGKYNNKGTWAPNGGRKHSAALKYCKIGILYVF